MFQAIREDVQMLTGEPPVLRVSQDWKSHCFELFSSDKAIHSLFQKIQHRFFFILSAWVCGNFCLLSSNSVSSTFFLFFWKLQIVTYIKNNLVCVHVGGAGVQGSCGCVCVYVCTRLFCFYTFFSESWEFYLEKLIVWTQVWRCKGPQEHVRST